MQGSPGPVDLTEQPDQCGRIGGPRQPHRDDFVVPEAVTIEAPDAQHDRDQKDEQQMPGHGGTVDPGLWHAQGGSGVLAIGNAELLRHPGRSHRGGPIFCNSSRCFTSVRSTSPRMVEQTRVQSCSTRGSSRR